MKLIRTLLGAVAVFVNAAHENHGYCVGTLCLKVNCHDAFSIGRWRLTLATGGSGSVRYIAS